MTSAVAIITARGGSKRIPRKNIKPFCGKPIIAYSIQAALESGLFDDVIVSTDDEEIANVSREYGASVPFMRSAANSDDFAGTEDALREVLLVLEEHKRSYSEFCCLYPTAPFVTASKLCQSYKLLQKEGIDSVLPVTQFSFPPQRGVVVESGHVRPVDDVAMMMRSQDLTPVYHDCGQFYWCNVDSFLKRNLLVGDHTAPFVVSEIEVQDIDNETDWLLAELKYEFLRSAHGEDH